MFEMNSKISVNIGKDRNRSISVLNTILSHIINYSKLINNDKWQCNMFMLYDLALRTVVLLLVLTDSAIPHLSPFQLTIDLSSGHLYIPLPAYLNKGDHIKDLSVCAHLLHLLPPDILSATQALGAVGSLCQADA